MCLTSKQLKGKKKILDWAPANFHKLKESSKVKIYCAHLAKALPDKVDMTMRGEIDHYHKFASEQLDRDEAAILGQALPRFQTSSN